MNETMVPPTQLVGVTFQFNTVGVSMIVPDSKEVRKSKNQ
jgi:hypothetical protein